MIWAVLLIGATVAFYVAVARHLKRVANPPRVCRHAPLEVLDGTVDGICWSCGERIPHA